MTSNTTVDRHRGPPSAGFLLFQGTLAKPNNCLISGPIGSGTPPYLRERRAVALHWALAVQSPVKTFLSSKKFFKKIVDRHPILSHKLPYRVEWGYGCLILVGGKI